MTLRFGQLLGERFECFLDPRDAASLPQGKSGTVGGVALEGELLVNIDGVEQRLTTGGMTFTPRGTPHSFLVVSEQARLLTMQTPGIGQSFYRDASEPTTEATSATFDIERIQASARENPRGIQLLGPSPFERAPFG